MTDDDVRLTPLLHAEGLEPRFTAANAPTMAEWRTERTRAYGQSALSQNEKEQGVEEEVINGVVVRHYN